MTGADRRIPRLVKPVPLRLPPKRTYWLWTSGSGLVQCGPGAEPDAGASIPFNGVRRVVTGASTCEPGEVFSVEPQRDPTEIGSPARGQWEPEGQ